MAMDPDGVTTLMSSFRFMGIAFLGAAVAVAGLVRLMRERGGARSEAARGAVEVAPSAEPGAGLALRDPRAALRGVGAVALTAGLLTALAGSLAGSWIAVSHTALTALLLIPLGALAALVALAGDGEAAASQVLASSEPRAADPTVGLTGLLRR